MDETIVEDIPHVSEQENKLLTHNFFKEEVKEAIFQMKHNTTPGPDGFPPEFYQVFWNAIKEDLMALFEDFHHGTLALTSLNFGTIILLPKINESKQIQQYRPIYLLNVCFKLFTKIVTNSHKNSCGSMTPGTHKTRHGPHHQRWPNPRDQGVRRTALVGLHRKATRKRDLLDIVPNKIFFL
jgi:hypothetical protein